MCKISPGIRTTSNFFSRCEKVGVLNISPYTLFGKVDPAGGWGWGGRSSNDNTKKPQLITGSRDSRYVNKESVKYLCHQQISTV